METTRLFANIALFIGLLVTAVALFGDEYGAKAVYVGGLFVLIGLALRLETTIAARRE